MVVKLEGGIFFIFCFGLDEICYIQCVTFEIRAFLLTSPIHESRVVIAVKNFDVKVDDLHTETAYTSLGR